MYELGKKRKNQENSPVKTVRIGENTREIIEFREIFPSDEHIYREELEKNRIIQEISPMILKLYF